MSSVNLLTPSQRITYAIDAWSANQDKRTGVEQYAYQVIQAMKQEPLRADEQVILFSPTPLSKPLSDLPPQWEAQILPWKFKRGWMSCRVQWELFRHPPHVFFVPAQSVPPFFRHGLVTTLHDVAPLRMPLLYNPAVARRVTAATKRAVRHAEQIIAVSEFTRSEIVSLFHLPQEKITVTPLASDTDVFRRLTHEEIQTVLQSHRLGQHFFLFVGRLEKKKNVTTVIRAFEQFKEMRGMGDPFELVLVGEPGFGFHDISLFIERSAQKEVIRLLGYLPDTDVASLMNATAAFLFPSWYEGFGLPLVESMACGAPLLLSDIAVHHEVVGPAGIFLSPDDPDAWAQALSQIVEDTQRKEDLLIKENLRSANFSWKVTAQKTWEVLRSMI